MKSTVLLSSLVASAAAVSLWLVSAPAPLHAESHVESAGNALAVTIAVAKRGTPANDFTVPASLQAFQDTGIFARTGGYLAKWEADLGDRVKAGQVLAVIDAPELDQELNTSRAKLQQAQANLELAKSSANRWKELGTQNAVAQQEVDEKQSAFAARQADLAAAEAEVSRLTQLKSYQSITAPFDGVITARNTNIGMLVTASGGKELFHLAQTDPLRVYVGVPQNYVRTIKPGITAEVSVTEFPGKVFTGKVVRSAGAMDIASRTLLTEIQIPNPDGKLFAGMFSQVRFKITAAPTIVVPSTALQIGTNGAQVAVIDATNHVHWQKVKIGRDFGAQVEISEGLAEGAKLVSPPSDAVVEGVLVAPIVPATPAPAAAAKKS
jgi:RND family efflux transporter MFP subunit